jgi:secreted trypsin-like serine protease
MVAKRLRSCAWLMLIPVALIGALGGLAVAPANGARAGASRVRADARKARPTAGDVRAGTGDVRAGTGDFRAGSGGVRSRAGGADRTHSPRAHASIVGGADATIARFPFQVALYNPGAGSPAAGFFCGGVIVDATHVITAAHCLVTGSSGRVSTPQEIMVLAGSTRLAPTDPGSVRAVAASAVIDPLYSPQSSDYDIGIVTLAHPLWSGSTPPSLDGASTIAPLPVDAATAAAYGEANASPAVLATVSGWGDTSPAPSNAPTYPTSLQAAQVPLTSETACQEAYASIEQTITPRMLCAGGLRPRADSCYGDSGGPLVVDRDSPARPPGDYVLVGLVDFGNGCDQTGYPGVYTRIADPAVAHFLASGVGHNATAAGAHRGKKRRRRHRH